MLTAPEVLAELELEHSQLKDEYMELSRVCSRLQNIILRQLEEIEALEERRA